MRASKAETEIATLRGRSERLAEEIATSAARIRQLEVDLVREREATAALAQAKATAQVRWGANQQSRASSMRRRKL